MSVGDPHIVTVYGEILEMPHKIREWTMLENENIKITTKTRYFSEKEKMEIREYYREVTGREDVERLVTNGVVQEEVRIVENERIIEYKFGTRELKSNVEISELDIKLIKRVDGVGISIKLDEKEVILEHYNNPQVYSGIRVKGERFEDCVGWLVGKIGRVAPLRDATCLRQIKKK